MGNDIKSLKERFAYLKRVFASGDKSGMTDDIFNKFLSQARTGVDFFTDDRLTNKAKNHENINYFCDAAAKKVLASFLISKNSNDNTIRGPLYSNRRAIDFDGYKIIPPRNPITNLGLPAFNKGSKIFSTQDFDNGLGLLINGVQYAYIFVEEFGLNSIGIPKIRFKFLFYDVFGLDDDDLYEYGTSIKDNALGFAAAQGINSWWQLQHQFNYKPVITRIPITKEYTLYNKIVGVQGVGYGFDL
ncbi:hypothetical protein [Vibrio nereis]|uniref:hypothetical protein n=1 Tax=Vibrio nereis TaxID=693 RepID=UPI002495A532|nr:hypothetical protein [Vibrio nereis]